MNNFPLNLKEIKKKYGIEIQNPYYSKNSKSIKEQFMCKLNRLYRSKRIFFQKIFRESAITKILLDGHEKDCFSYRKECNSPSSIHENSVAQEHYFEIEYITIIEVISKENIRYLKQGIDKFIKKHGEQSDNIEYSKWFDSLEYFGDSEFSVPIGTCNINQKSSLKDYIKVIEIRIDGLTTTTAMVSYQLHISQYIKNILNCIAINHMPSYNYISRSSKRHWWNFRQLGCDYVVGTEYKKKLKYIIEEEIKWRFMQEILKYVSAPIFQTNKTNIAFCVYKTNVDGNNSEDFWNSVGIYNRFCDYFKGGNQCISWENQISNNIYYIYIPTDPIFDFIYPHDMASYFSKYIVCREIIYITRNILSKYSKIASYLSINNKKFKEWLKIKKHMESDLAISKRFLNEYQYTSFYDSKMLIEDLIITNKKSIMQEEFESQKFNVDNCKNTIKSVNDVLEAGIASLSADFNYKLQQKTLITNLFSAVFALIAIMLTIFGNKVVNLKTLFTHKIIIISFIIIIVIAGIIYLMWKIREYYKFNRHIK